MSIDTGEVRVPRMVEGFCRAHRQRKDRPLSTPRRDDNEAARADRPRPRFGHYANHDLAEYHVAVNTDVGEMDVSWIDEHDPYVNPMRAKGIGEIGILGTAIAVHHATDIRVRGLPITLDKSSSDEEV